MSQPLNPNVIKQVRLRCGLRAIVWAAPPEAVALPFVRLGFIATLGYQSWQRSGAWREDSQSHPLDIATPITDEEIQDLSWQ